MVRVPTAIRAGILVFLGVFAAASALPDSWYAAMFCRVPAWLAAAYFHAELDAVSLILGALLASVPALYDIQVTDLGNGSSQLDFVGIPGRAYTVQYATSLQAADWQPLGVVTADTVGSCLIIDTSANAGQRVYRATQP